jgi:hypothetical protein
MVRTLVFVPRTPFLVQPGKPVPDLIDHQRTQVALVKSRLVLNVALRDPEVARLSMVAGHLDPVEWLEGQVVADFSHAPEVLRIGMYGDKTEELVVLVNALRKAYLSEIVERETKQRHEKLEVLHTLHDRYVERLKEGRRAQAALEQLGAPPGDAVARALTLNFFHQQLLSGEQELVKVQSDLRKARLELEAAKARQKGPGDLADPDQAAKVSDRQRRVALLEGNVRALQSEAQRRREDIAAKLKHAAKLDDVKEDLGHIEKLIQNIAAEELALQLELDAPKREKVLETALVTHVAAGPGRLTTAAVVGLAFALAAFALVTFRVRVSVR